MMIVLSEAAREGNVWKRRGGKHEVAQEDGKNRGWQMRGKIDERE